jgi:Iron-containing redox enzyme
MSQSTRLRAKIDLVIPASLAQTTQLWNGPDPVTAYRRWLVVLHQMIRATVPLMVTALTECQGRTGDETAAALAGYFARHIRDEFGHDQWVAADLERAGGDLAALSDPPPATVAALVGSQYYWIRHAHPVALLGHIAVLEGYPPHPGLVGRLADRTGLPHAAFYTMERHASLDVAHRDELLRTVDKIPMTGWHEQLMGISALATVSGLGDVVALVAQATSGSRASA